MLKLTYITTHIAPAAGCSLVGVVDDKGVQKSCLALDRYISLLSLWNSDWPD